MTLEIGARPIVVSMYPSTGYGPLQIELLRSLHRAQERMGVPIWDLWGGVAADSGSWLPGMSLDGDHPSDLGHQRMYEGIPSSQVWTAPRRSNSSPEAFSDLHLRSPDRPGATIWLTLDRIATSWTFASWVRDASDSGFYLAAGEGLGFRLRKVDDGLVAESGSNVLLRIPADRPFRLWRHYALVYRESTRSLSLYADGVLKSTATLDRSLSTSEFALAAGACPSCAFAHAKLYRTALAAHEVGEIHRGVVLRKSLEIWAPLQLATIDGSPNFADTVARVDLEGDWQPLQPIGPGPCPFTPTAD
jgi:hypothetical protein